MIRIGSKNIKFATIGTKNVKKIFLGSKRLYPTVLDTGKAMVKTAPGASYGFSLNANVYYESDNKGIGNSAAVCVVHIENPDNLEVYIDCINYAESGNDYGVLSKIGQTLSTTNSYDSSYFKSFSYSHSAEVQSVYYGQISGDIYIKYRKDGSMNYNNDSLQFKIRFVEPEPAPPPVQIAEGVTLEQITGADYGFALNANGYYESQNKGVSNSYAICKIKIQNPDNKYVHLECINYAESGYDYGLVSKINEMFTSDKNADSSYFYSFRYSNSSSPRIITYGQVSGEIYIKFIKDSGYNQYNDSLQFKVILSDSATITASTSDYI